jgi:hypothetical protein
VAFSASGDGGGRSPEHPAQIRTRRLRRLAMPNNRGHWLSDESPKNQIAAKYANVERLRKLRLKVMAEREKQAAENNH